MDGYGLGFTMIYEGAVNDKHKHPWQRGRRGSLCPKDMATDLGQHLLDTSEPTPGKEEPRWSTDGTRAYAARRHADDRWHGHPAAWKEVPESLRSRWVRDGRIAKRDVRRYWDDPQTT